MLRLATCLSLITVSSLHAHEGHSPVSSSQHPILHWLTDWQHGALLAATVLAAIAAVVLLRRRARR